MATRTDGGSDKKKIEELKRLLAEERQVSKRTIGKLQRELQRYRSEHPPASQEVRDSLLKEIEKERMMRLGTEQRLQDMQLESDSCRARLHALQEEFRKMEEMVANMLQYKAKIDQLKQENASMKSSYESNLQKYCTHISTLERDNMLLRNQVKKMEAQLHGKGDERDKSKLLLERLKMVEAENSSLVLENEQQRQQYEKCLDEIANQVVQALLAQKTLREECLKLQTRVQDLELQNKHLNILFQQRMRFTSDSVLQVQHTSCITTNHVCRTGTAANAASALTQGEMTLDFLENAGSLQSMCSEIMGDDSPGKPQLSSPPPWLRDRMAALTTGEGDSSPTSSTSSTSTASPGTPEAKDQVVQTKIETEFPATNSSPKVKHISVYERRTRSLERGAGGPFSWMKRAGKGGNRSRRGSDSQDKGYFLAPRLKQSTSADAISHFGIGNKISSSQAQLLAEAIQWKKTSSQDRLAPQTLLQSLSTDDSPAVLIAGGDFNHKSFEAFNKSFEKLLAKNSSEDTSDSTITAETVSPLAIKSSAHSQQQQQQQQSQQQKQQSSHQTPSTQSPAIHRRQMKAKSSPSPALRNPFVDPLKSPRSPSNVPSQYYYYDYSDEDSDSRPVSRDFSTASTMSLNELLDSSMEGEVALDDDFFSDWSSVCISPKKRIDRLTGITISNSAMESKLRIASSSSSSRSRSTSSSPEASGIPVKPSPKDNKSKQTDGVGGAKAARSSPAKSSNPQTSTKQSSQQVLASKPNAQEKVSMRSSDVSKTISQQVKSRIVEGTVTSQPKTTQVAAEVHAEDMPESFLPSPSPSPNLSQKSQDLGYASKGSYSQSSPSPSPSMSHRGTPPWLQSGKDNHSTTRNELLTLVINREAMGASPRSVSNGASPVQSPKLTRPGQLILAPQDKNFNFQGFSSASSTSSEDKSPMKIFESRHNSDMKSSVIEVKQDGTFVHSMRSIDNSNSETSGSLSVSPCSPVKSPSKIPPPVAKKPVRAVKPESRAPPKDDKDKSSKDSPTQFPSTNITVGFLLHNQISFPGQTNCDVVEEFIKKSMTDSKIKPPSNQPQDFGNPFQTKCQSSDSSFENLRVERSGSKDDGYSTMSSDIHPEILEKFSDTLTRKLSTAESEPTHCTEKNSVAEHSPPHHGARRNSDPTLHSRDRSFDLTSDPDSALETSVHSTAEMVTSSSSQVSTSSSDHPLSPCSTKVSKMARLFDGENTKLNFVHTGGHNSPCSHKSNRTSSHGSSNSSSPGSPNAFVPSCYQQPESPRRLTNEFQKVNTAKSACPVAVKKDSPESPKNLSKSFGFSKHSSKQQQQHLPSGQQNSGIPKLSSSKKSPPDSKSPSPIKTEVSKSSLPTAVKRLPKGFYSSPQQGAKTSVKQTKGTISGSDKNAPVIRERSNSDVQKDKSEKAPVKDGSSVTVKKLEGTVPFGSGTQGDVNKKQRCLNTSPPKEGGKVLAKDKSKGSKGKAIALKCHTNNYATSSSNISPSIQPSDCKDEIAIEKEGNDQISSSSKRNVIDNVCKNGKGASSCKSNVDPCRPQQTSNTSGDGYLYNSKQGVKSSAIVCDSSVNNVAGMNSVSKADISPSTLHPPSHPVSALTNVTKTVSSTQTHHIVLTASMTNDCAPPSKSSNHQSLIIMTNQGFQQISSESENNEDDDSSSLPSVTYDDNFLEDIPEENDTSDGYMATDSNRVSVSSGFPVSNNITTTNTSTLQTNQQQCSASTSAESSIVCSTAQDPNAAASTDDHGMVQSSTSTRQQLQLHPSHNGFNAHPALTNLPQLRTLPSRSTAGRTSQCLARAKSEQNLSIKPKSTSAYDDFFGMAWDSGKVLERSKSVSELDLLSHSSRVIDELSGQGYCWTLADDRSNCCSRQLQHYKGHKLGRQWVLLPPPPLPPPSVSLTPDYSNNFCQLQHHRYHPYQQQQHLLHPLHQHQNPWAHALRLDLSDVTELDEDGSELATTRESLNTSQLGLISDESPRLDVDEQKRFNSQFYSLCKVDSNRSLLSSGNESRERLSLTSLNEILNNKSFDKGSDSHVDSNTKDNNGTVENPEDEIAIKEFDEISRQIATLSKTVDELNQSLSSLNSGEFEPSSQGRLGTSPVPPADGASRLDVIDGYHWVDDEFFLTSCNGEVIIGGSCLIGDDSYADIFSNNSFDVNSTEDATSEFYQVPLHSQHNPFAYRNSAGQDEIFAGSFFDTVKEKVPLRQKKKPVLHRSGSDGNLSEKIPVAEKRLSMPVFQHDGEKEGGGKRERGNRGGKFTNSRWLMEGQGDDQLEILTGSNNDSDDSLASDIGLDHMMCQRLFGRKGRFQPSTNHNRPVVDFAKFFVRYGDSEKEAVAAFDFLDNFSCSESLSRGKHVDRTSWGSVHSPVVNGQNGVIVNGHSQTNQVSGFSNEGHLKETRDVGVDAMSQSQQSMNASFETFDQSMASLDAAEAAAKAANEIAVSNDSPDLSSSQSLHAEDKSVDNGEKLRQRRKTTDLSVASNIEIVAHGSCDQSEARGRSHSLKDSSEADSLTTYKDFVADLRQSFNAVDSPPPKLPPRRPIITNGSLHASLERDIPPLPPPPPFLDNEHFHQQHQQGIGPSQNHYQISRHHHHHHHPHQPYVNQFVPPLAFHTSKSNFTPRPMSDPFVCVPSHPGMVPPPLPPRQPQISRTQDGRPQVLIRPHRIHRDSRSSEGRPHSFNHYLIDKSKAALPSPSSPAPLSTYPRPRSRSETTDVYNQKSLYQEKNKDDFQASRIPRRKLKTRRERSKRKQSSDKSSGEASVKVSDSVSGSSGRRQWRDIDVVNGQPLTESSCEDNSSS